MFPVEAALDKAEPRIKPGMTGDIRIFVREEANVLALPLESVRSEAGKSFVTRVVGKADTEHTEKVRVVVGSANDHLVEIVSGVGEGERILVDPGSAKDNETKI